MNQEKRPSDLSPEAKRALLARLLREKAGRADATHSLSLGQRGLWMVHQLEPQSAAYNVAVAVRITSPLDLDALKRAFQALLDRHASLRSTFDAAEGEPIQKILARRDLAFEVLSVAGEDPGAIRARMTSASRRPFDLVEGPLFRVTVFSRSDSEHFVLVLVHHIVFDGWSAGLMLNECFALYTAETTGQTPGGAAALPPATHQYADFVRWQADMLEGEEGKTLWAYWERQLAGNPSPLDLPTDRPRPAAMSPRGATHRGRIEARLAEPFRDWLRAEGATLYMGMLALFQALLHRYSGQPDILVGSPTAGRGRPEFERVIGYFVNPVVMRADLGDNPTFREHLARVKAVTLDALKHADYPFPLLVQRLAPNRDASRTPLFQVMFNLLKPSQISGATAVGAEGAAPGLAGSLAAEPVALPQQEGQFDLELDVIDYGEELETAFKYSTDLFDPTTIERMQGHLKTLLRSVLAQPAAQVSELELLTPEEQAQLVSWNETAADYPRGALVHGLFEEQVRRTPDAVAVAFEDRALTYRELDERASRLARHLAGLGVEPDVLVALCLERSLDMVVALLAVLKAGGAYVPLDPGYPKERLALMLEDSGARILLTDAVAEPLLPEHGARAVRVDQEPEDTTGGAAKPLRPTPAHLAYVIYTSGSTGRPKGVGVSHGAVANFLHAMSARPGLSAGDVLLSVTTLSFDIFGLELYLPLAVGARVVLVGRDEAADGERLLVRLRSSGATVMQATPATWRLLLEAGWSGDPPLRAFCGGEALPRELVAQLLERATEVWNLYGPTETTIWSAAAKLAPGDPVVSIGRPIANTQIHILDAHLHRVPVGVAGELYIGGDGLARGYLNRPDLTAERFVADPFAPRPGARLYRTGDLARYLLDGRIECLGRVDQQVKVRGFRIELGEIEAALGTHPAVKVAVVTARETASGEKQLVAYLAHGAGAEPTVTELRNFLKATLPPHMVPSSFVFLDELPLTPNGKVDRKALARLDRGRTQAADAYVAPRTPMETFVTDLWKEALGIERVSVRDNFFDLGGHSLLAMKVIAKVEKKIGERLNPREMIYQTLEQFAAICEQRASAGGPATPQGLGSKLLGALKGAFETRRPASE